jgi:alkylhydroperoxidase/carboxymuconolactone decarboxylase family protein YurZ
MGMSNFVTCFLKDESDATAVEYGLIAAGGPLDSKQLHLVQLAAAAAIRSEGAVHSHARRALAEGVTPDEIRHALISLTSTIGFPNVTASLSWCEDVFKAAKAKSAR